MKEFWSFDGGYTRIGSKIFDVLLLGILWLICCIPVATIGAASSALYYSVVKCVRSNRGYAAKEFLHGLKVNGKAATVGWLTTLLIAAAARWNLSILDRMEATNFTAFLLVLNVAILVVLAGMNVYFYPVVSRFEGRIGRYIGLSAYLMLRHIGITLLGLLALAMAFVFILRLPLLILVLPGPVCLLLSELLEKPLLSCRDPDTRG